MAKRLQEIVSPDGKWKAWVALHRGLNSRAYSFNVQRNNFFGRLTRKSEDLGCEYYDPSSQFQFPEMPIGRALRVDSVTFSAESADLRYTETHHFAYRPKTEAQEICSIKLG